jgi:hypothetical protein
MKLRDRLLLYYQRGEIPEKDENPHIDEEKAAIGSLITVSPAILIILPVLLWFPKEYAPLPAYLALIFALLCVLAGKLLALFVGAPLADHILDADYADYEVGDE